MEFVHMHMLKGPGHKQKPYVNKKKLLENKRSVIQIRNSDYLCCARALVTAMARTRNHPQWDSIRERKYQRNLPKTFIKRQVCL